MIGIVVVAHQDLAEALVRAAEGIAGPLPGVYAVALSYQDPTDAARRRLEKVVRRADTGEGVLVLTDMFGGTPTNLSLPFLEPGRVEVLTGVNLPVLLKAHSARADTDVAGLARQLREYGLRSFVLASELWNARPGEGPR
ncbi:MAG: hypothetical protein GXP50_12380 [Deltaproteobacteria bacterium]|nr:hypothetical protein [Deltaproteobacteria bacterium]